MTDIAAGLSYGQKQGLIGMLYAARYNAQDRAAAAVASGNESARQAAQDTCIRISKDIASIRASIGQDGRNATKERSAREQALVDGAIKRIGVKAWIDSYETYTAEQDGRGA